MTLEETGELLAHAALVDNRKTDPAIVIAWHSILGDLPYADCEEAVRAHYAETSNWLMPAHVRNRVKEARRQRIFDAGIPAPPPELLDSPRAYGAALQAAATAIADGRDPDSAMQAIASRAHRELEA